MKPRSLKASTGTRPPDSLEEIRNCKSNRTGNRTRWVALSRVDNPTGSEFMKTSTNRTILLIGVALLVILAASACSGQAGNISSATGSGVVQQLTRTVESTPVLNGTRAAVGVEGSVEPRPSMPAPNQAEPTQNEPASRRSLLRQRLPRRSHLRRRHHRRRRFRLRAGRLCRQARQSNW